MDYERDTAAGEALGASDCAPGMDVAGERADRLRLGEILVATGRISERQLEQALRRKRETGRRIGEELVAAGHVSSDLVERALAAQRRLVFAASLAALSPLNSLTLGHATAGEARTYMSVSATVVDTVSIKSLHQARNLVITAQDIERGYVDVPGASKLEIRNSRPCLFEFKSSAENVFRSVRITGVQGAAEFGAEGGTLLQTGFGNGASKVEVGYRFTLAPGVRPGAYAWPIALTVLPL